MIRVRNLLLLFAAIAMASPLDLLQWRYRKSIPVTPGNDLSVVKLDRDVYVGASGLGDLRVVRDGVEVPYLLETLEYQNSDVSKTVEPFDLAVTGQGVQFTIKAGRSPHNRIRLTTGERNFRQKVQIEAGADNQHWATLRSDGAIFDFTQDGRQFSSLGIEFPVSTKPYLRVTIFGWRKTASVEGVAVDYEVKRSAAFETLATITPQLTEDSKSQETLATLDLGVQGLPVNRIVLETSSPRFQRAVDAEASRDGNDWSFAGQGVIARLPGPDYTEESLILAIPETQARYIRVRIFNRDDQPIKVASVRLEGLIRYVDFLAPEPGAYALYYGNPSARAPVYDLAAVLQRDSKTRVSRTLGPAEANPLYRPPAPPKKPWSEEHPAILYGALVAAVLGLAIATLRFASRLGPSSQQP